MTMESLKNKKNFTFREFDFLLKQADYTPLRVSGDHVIYSNGAQSVSVPRNSKTINRMLARRLIKEHNLIKRK